MRTRKTLKTASPALHLAPSEAQAAQAQVGNAVPPHGRGSRRGVSTRPVAQAAPVTQLALRMPEAALPAVASGGPGMPGMPGARLDAARPARPTIVRPAAAPHAPAPAVRRHLGELREALQDGWEIVQPIFARPLWSAADDSATAFNFVLRGPSGTRLITVPEGRGVERFIRDRQLRVDYAR